MNDHIAPDLLAAYVDDALEAETKAELEQHLEQCDECSSLLEEAEAPVGLEPADRAEGSLWDEKRMRKTVRRTLLGAALKAISIWIIGFVVVAAISSLAFQPLVIGRGDRARRAAVATWDLPVLITPGASVDSWTTDATLLGRDLKVELVRFVGSQPRPLGTFETHLGIFSFAQHDTTTVNPYVGGGSHKFVPDQLPAGTVVTVRLQWLEQPITIAEAEALRPNDDEARLLWAGFDVSPALPEDPQRFPGDLGATLGYHPCEEPTILDLERSYFRSGFAMAGGNVAGCLIQPVSVAHALEQTRRAAANLASDRDLVQAMSASSFESLQNIEQVAAWLADNQPAVTTLVITGPTPNVTHILETSGADDAVQLDVDFWNWTTP